MVNSTIRVTVPDLDLPTSLFWAYQWFLKTGGGGAAATGEGGCGGRGKVTPLSSVVKFPLTQSGSPSQSLSQ